MSLNPLIYLFRRSCKYGVFYKKKWTDKIWWVRNPHVKGPKYFTFDKKKIYSYWQDYPFILTAREKEIFDKENPYWAEFRSGITPEMIEKHSKKKKNVRYASHSYWEKYFSCDSEDE